MSKQHWTVLRITVNCIGCGNNQVIFTDYIIGYCSTPQVQVLTCRMTSNILKFRVNRVNKQCDLYWVVSVNASSVAVICMHKCIMDASEVWRCMSKCICEVYAKFSNVCECLHKVRSEVFWSVGAGKCRENVNKC